MDYPKSVPSVGLVNGKFVDENAVNGTPGSLIPAVWGNAVTEELLNVVQAGGLTPSETARDQLLTAVRVVGRASTASYVADTGDSNVYVANYTPAVTLLVDGLRLCFKARITNTGASSFSPNGLVAKPVIGGAHAALQGGEIVEGGDVWVQYNTAFGGGSWVLISSSGGALQLPQGGKSQHSVNVVQVQTQSVTAFTTAGTAVALTLSTVPPVAAYTANLRFRVKFSAASNGAATLNVSGLGAKSLKQYDPAGAKVSAIFTVGQLADVEYDGVDFVVIDRLPAFPSSLVGVQGSSKNLKLSSTGLDSNISVSADELVVLGLDKSYKTIPVVSRVVSFANTGINGLDVGAANSQAANTWYSVWVIVSDISTACLLSLSGTEPTLPVGYTHKARVGWVRTDSTANKFPVGFVQYGRVINLLSEIVIAAGAASYGPVSIAGVCPVSAQTISGTITATAVGILQVTVGPSVGLVLAHINVVNGYSPNKQSFNFALRDRNIYWGSSNAGVVGIHGWEESL